MGLLSTFVSKLHTNGTYYESISNSGAAPVVSEGRDEARRSNPRE
jgi:hypothetical protein